jgi:anti-sigma regulatory factor (Ser/Thr protein kinase)
VDAVASNAVEHAGGRGLLVLHRQGLQLECRISDDGPGFSEEALPARPPGGGRAACGRGLWLTRRMTDRLTISRKLRGTVVTLGMPLR